MVSSSQNNDADLNSTRDAKSNAFGLSFPMSFPRLNPPQRPSSSLSLISSLDLGEPEFAAEGSISAVAHGNASTERLYTNPNRIIDAEMASVDSLASRPHTYRQLVIIDDITYFSTMYAKFTGIPFAELSDEEVQARVAVIRSDLLAENQIPDISLFRVACIHSILAHIEHPKYVPSITRLDSRAHVKAAATAIATIRALGINEGDQLCLRLLEERNTVVRRHWEGGLPICQESVESDFTPSRLKIWWEKLKHRGLLGGGRHALGWEDPGPKGAGGRGKEREERGDAVSVGPVLGDTDDEQPEVRTFC